jgi:hypothetical protein
MTSAKFQTAVEDSRKLKSKPSDDELLQVSTPLLRSTSTCLAIATVIEIAVMVPECLPCFCGRRNSMIPHPPATAPGWQDPIRRLPYHLISVSGHDTPNMTLCQEAGEKKDYHKDSHLGIIVATLGAQMVQFFVSIPPMAALRLRQSPNSPACRPALQHIFCG